MSPVVAMVMLVTLFFWIHYFFSSITAHTAAVLPVVLAVDLGMPNTSMPTLTLLCMYSLGIMGIISPYATGPAPIYFGSGYIAKGDDDRQQATRVRLGWSSGSGDFPSSYGPDLLALTGQERSLAMEG